MNMWLFLGYSIALVWATLSGRAMLESIIKDRVKAEVMTIKKDIHVYDDGRCCLGTITRNKRFVPVAGKLYTEKEIKDITKWLESIKREEY